MDTTMMGSIDAITWFSESITVIPKIAAGAKYTVTIPGTTAPMVVVGRGTGASTDDGVEFELPDYATGHATAEGMARMTTVTVTVTAANGYHDHGYSFEVSRAAPGRRRAGRSQCMARNLQWNRSRRSSLASMQLRMSIVCRYRQRSCLCTWQQRCRMSSKRE